MPVASDAIEEVLGPGFRGILDRRGIRKQGMRVDRQVEDALPGPVDPPSYDTRVDLGMELQTDAQARSKGHWTGVGPRDLPTSWRNAEDIFMPTEPRTARDQIGRVAVHDGPSDLEGVCASHRPLQSERQRLPTEADTEDRYLNLMGFAQERDLSADPSLPRGVRRAVRAQADNRVALARIRPGCERGDIQRFEGVSPPPCPPTEKPGGRLGFVLEDQDLH